MGRHGANIDDILETRKIQGAKEGCDGGGYPKEFFLRGVGGDG